MALREIIILPDKQLRLVSKPDREGDAGDPQARRRHVRDHVRRARHRARGDPGRAADAARHHGPRQEGREGETKPQPRVFINPEIIWSSEEKSVYEEGCLSIPEYYEEVERPARVRVRFTDLDGKVHEEDAEGLFATCIQHEIDHLNGVLFIDHISKLKRDRVVKKFTKAAKRAAE